MERTKIIVLLDKGMIAKLEEKVLTILVCFAGIGLFPLGVARD